MFNEVLIDNSRWVQRRKKYFCLLPIASACAHTPTMYYFVHHVILHRNYVCFGTTFGRTGPNVSELRLHRNNVRNSAFPILLFLSFGTPHRNYVCIGTTFGTPVLVILFCRGRSELRSELLFLSCSCETNSFGS